MEFISNYKKSIKMRFIVTVFILVILGLMNLIINMDEVLKYHDGELSPFVIYTTTITASVVSFIICIVVLSIVMYFVAAAMQKGFDITKFLSLSILALQWLPLQVLVNNIIGLFGLDINKLSFLVTLIYIPVYIFAGYIIFNKASLLVETTTKQSFILSLFGVVSLILLTGRF